MRVAVVTSTIGTEHLNECVQSVASQDYEYVDHYVFIDGKRYFADAEKILSSAKVKKILLEENTGSDGWLGHRVYASCSFLVNSDLICYLDEDNWIAPDHVRSLVETISKGNDWAFSLRKIFDKSGHYLFDDNCESLGKWPVYCHEDAYHIDTSCYMVKTSVAASIGHTWFRKWDADRQFFAHLRNFYPQFDCSGRYTLCYRLGGNERSASREFFEAGNRMYKAKYKHFPWSS